MFKQAAKDIMTKKVITASRETTIGELSRILIQNNISGVPVVDKDGILVGMATDADIITEDLEPIFPIYFDPLIISYAFMDNFEKFEKSMKEYLATPVAEIMVKRVKTVRQDTPVSEVARIMVKDRINRIPVVDESNKVTGIISRADILKSMIGEIRRLKNLLNNMLKEKPVLDFLKTKPHPISITLQLFLKEQKNPPRFTMLNLLLMRK